MGFAPCASHLPQIFCVHLRCAICIISLANGAKTTHANKWRYHQRVQFILVNSPFCISGMETHASVTYLFHYQKTNRAGVLFALIKPANKEGHRDPVEYMITQGQKPPDKSRHIIPNAASHPSAPLSFPAFAGELGVCLSKCHSVMNINVRRCQRDVLWGRLKAALSRVYLPHVMNSRGSDTNRAASESR